MVEDRGREHMVDLHGRNRMVDGRGSDRMVTGFTYNNAINAYHHLLRFVDLTSADGYVYNFI
jgi:hypothetical protein